MTFHLKIKIKLEAIKTRLLELKDHIQNLKPEIQSVPQMNSIFVEFGKILSPNLVYFDCFNTIQESLKKKMNNTINTSNVLIWSKNLFYLIYFFTNNNDEFHKISEFLFECINEIKNEYDEEIICPLENRNPNDYLNIEIYHFFEESATRIFMENKIDFYCGKDTKNSCFIPKDLLEKTLLKKSMRKDSVSNKFLKIYKQWNIESMIIKEYPNIFADRNFQLTQNWAPKKTIPLFEIKVNNVDNQSIKLELLGDYSRVEGSSCEIHLINERIVFFKIFVQSIKSKNRIEINIPRNIYDASYLITIESTHFSSNPIQYDHHHHFPHSQKIKLNQCYVDCCHPNFKNNLLNHNLNYFLQKDFKQRNPLMIACLNESWENVKQIVRNKERLDLNLNDMDGKKKLLSYLFFFFL